jgi:uncharacterized membrane protein
MVDVLREWVSNPYLMIVVLTLLPLLELRASIPYGIAVLGREQWPVVFVIAAGVNILLGPIVFLLLDKFMHLLLKIPAVERYWNRVIAKTQKKIHPMVEKYGIWGLGLFIGVPLPGSGVYSGAMGGYLLGFKHREFLLSAVVGVLIAAAVVTMVMLTGGAALDIFIKPVPH